MKKNRSKKLIIVFAVAAAVIALAVLLICSGVRTGTAAPNGQKKETVRKSGQEKTEQKTEKESQR